MKRILAVSMFFTMVTVAEWQVTVPQTQVAPPVYGYGINQNTGSSFQMQAAPQGNTVIFNNGDTYRSLPNSGVYIQTNPQVGSSFGNY